MKTGRQVHELHDSGRHAGMISDAQWRVPLALCSKSATLPAHHTDTSHLSRVGLRIIFVFLAGRAAFSHVGGSADHLEAMALKALSPAQVARCPCGDARDHVHAQGCAIVALYVTFAVSRNTMPRLLVHCD